jgi:hypothetical protein
MTDTTTSSHPPNKPKKVRKQTGVKTTRGGKGVTRKEFHRLLKKASQPINESDGGQSQT